MMIPLPPVPVPVPVPDPVPESESESVPDLRPLSLSVEPLAKALFPDGSWSECRRDASTTKG